MAKYCSIGGQALIEGVMMRGKDTSAIAVRKPDNEIELKVETISGLGVSPLLRIPFIRGTVTLVSSMIIGTKALMWSAEFFEEEGEHPQTGHSKEAAKESAFEKFIFDKLGDKADAVVIWISLVIAMVMAILMFAVLPTTLVSLARPYVADRVVLSAMEGLTKMAVFVAYVALISKNRDIQRVYEYHGAEHKTIHCYEAGEELTPENAQKFTTLHPRCGTSFILIVIIVSITVFTFVSWDSVAMRVLLKIIMFPVIAGISYEIIKWTGNHDTGLSRAISYPGLMLQKLTTREPDLEQLEVAITAMKTVLERESENLKGGVCCES